MGGKKKTGTQALRSRRILVLETHQDHAELIAGALEEALMGVGVFCAMEPPPGDEQPPESVVVSMDRDAGPVLAWLDSCEILGQRPRVFLISGTEDPWPSSAIEAMRPEGQFEKSRGSRFLEALVLAVASRPQVERKPADPSPAANPAEPPVHESDPPPPWNGTVVVSTGDSPGIAIIQLDRDGAVSSASAGAGEVLGVDPSKLAPGIHLDEVFSRRWRDLSSDGWSALDPEGLLAGRVIRAGEMGFILLAGPAATLADADAAEMGAGRFLDEAGLRHSVVTSILARELRETLSVLSSLSDMTARGGLGRAERLPSRYALSIEQEVTRAQAIVRRIEAIHAPSQTSVHPELFEAHDLLALRIDGWRLLVPGGVEIVLESSGDEAPVRVCPGVIGPALDALVRVQAQSVAPSGELCLSTRNVALDAAFCIEHPGSRPGRFVRVRLVARLEPERRERGLEPRVLNESVVELGIAAVKAQGGYLRARHQNEESVLDLYLPAERSFLLESQIHQPAILCVDDEHSVRDVCTEILRQAGYRTVDVASGEDAVNLYLAGCRYDLVLLDYVMGGIDGAQTFDTLRVADPSIRVVLCTGSPYVKSIERMLAKGLLGLILKPFRLNRLLDLVGGALGRPSVGVL